MPSMNKNTPGIKGQEIVEQAHELIGLVEDAWRAGTAVHKLESNLFRKLLEMGSVP